jgi:hypothetical protein
MTESRAPGHFDHSNFGFEDCFGFRIWALTEWHEPPVYFPIRNLEPRDARRGATIGACDAAGIEQPNAGAFFISRHVRVAMQNNINILGRSLRRNVLESDTFLAADKIDHQRPLKIAVAISAHDGDARGNGTQFIQNSLRANIAQMPNLVRARSKIDNSWRQFVVRIGKNEYAEHFRWSNGAVQTLTQYSITPILDCFSQCSS